MQMKSSVKSCADAYVILNVKIKVETVAAVLAPLALMGTGLTLTPAVLFSFPMRLPLLLSS